VIRHHAASAVGVWCLVVLAPVQILFSFPEVLPEIQETLTHRGQQNQQLPEMRSRAGGNPSQGCQSVRNPRDRPPPWSCIPPPWVSPKSVIFRPTFSQGSRNSSDSLARPLESPLESPWRSKAPTWLPKWSKMDTKTCPKRLPERKTQNVSKSYYLMCFKHILVLPSTLKMWLFLPKSCPWLPWPPGGHPGVLNKPLGWHLQAILGAPGQIPS